MEDAKCLNKQLVISNEKYAIERNISIKIYLELYSEIPKKLFVCYKI